MSLPEPAASSPPRRDVRIVEDALQRHGLTPVEIAAVGQWALNQTFRARAGGRDFFVCIYRPGLEAPRLAAAERMARFVNDAGIPAALPIVAPDGKSTHVIERRLVAVFPWVDGVTLPRGAIDPDGAHRLGEVLGRLHAVLAGYDDPALRSGGSGAHWETEQAIDVLSRVDDLIRYYPAPPAWQQDVQRTLRRRLETLESGAARPRSDFDSLATQPAHGDFHWRNVLFDGGGQVAAVVDWDMCGRLPPVYEVLRAVSFSELLEEALLAAFLSGYRTNARIEPAVCHSGVEMWWQAQLHDTWAFRQRFIEGNRAVDPFFPDDAQRFERFSDPAFRHWLAEALHRYAT
ncbi:MAG: phosphotransferase [Dehalococcoidia bacterium]